ncbi:MAG: MjaII restriction endonuclease [Sulfuricurvum sp. PC08-66]|nr:MAG: MjaII restriction endonuclease [Sulfuricurvum sp. PC08-66]
MTQKDLILQNAQKWFRETIAVNHEKNTIKLKNPSEHQINPFLLPYLANFLEGETTPISIAKALVYPRALGTSITTSFGTNIQTFASSVLSSYGSMISGIDIEFVDQIDKTKKYCQLKSGPNTINKDDVETIAGHFRDAINLAKTNKLKVSFENFAVGVLYGEAKDLSGHYQRITKQYHHPVLVGEEFWHRLTGDTNFYFDLIESIAQVAIEANFKSKLDEVIEELSKSKEIEAIVKKLRQ